MNVKNDVGISYTNHIDKHEMLIGADSVFINKAADGTNNLCGKQIGRLRKELGLSQRQLAERLQLEGMDVDKNAIQRIETGKRFVTDIEIVYLCKVLGVSCEVLLSE